MMHGDLPGGRPPPDAPGKVEHQSTQLTPGTIVDHFRVMRLLGSGGMGEVYLARDTVLGRKVALKVVRLAAMQRNDLTRQILAEATATAAFNHPNIVTIYHVGEHRGRPYLALEYLEGQTLNERIREDGLSVSESQRIALSIACALVEAHSRKILHRDLKPRNVLIGSDGRVRVLDFGLALHMPEDAVPTAPPSVDLDVTEEQSGYEPMSTWSVAGSPPYMAPELWMGGTITAAVDIWSFGILLYELLSGRRPFPSSPMSELLMQVTSNAPAPALPVDRNVPPALADLVGFCLEKNPSKRPTAESIVEVLQGLIHPAAAEVSDEHSPFRGLRPFAERHASLFFGRDAEVETFLERMRIEPVIPIVGPTGAGKSSFVQAGVLPRLRARGRWTVVRLRPGPSPFHSLALALLRGATPIGGSHSTQRDDGPPGSSGDAETRRTTPLSLPPSDVDTLAEELLEVPALLSLRLHDMATSTATRVLLFVDQLEEICALVDDPAIRKAFMEAICRSADDPSEPVRAVFTLRDDFLGRLAEGPAAREKLSRLMLLRQPGTDALREIIEKPAAAMGYAYDDATLVDRMIEDVRGGASGLPLLQFATQVLWERRDRNHKLLLRSVYDELGGLAGMLAEHADTVLDGLTPDQLGVTRRLLLRLVTPEGTRAVVPRDRLIGGLSADADRIVDRLTEARLVTVHRARGDEDQGPTVELAHEALIRGWSTLDRWYRASRDELTFLAEVEQAAQLWDRRGRPDAEVWSEDALREARRRLQGALDIPDLVEAFLSRGEARRRAQSRARSITRAVITTGLSGIAIVAVLVAWAFAAKQREADAQRAGAELARTVAESERASAHREGARAAFADGRLIEARAKLRGSLETQDSPLARALWARLQRSKLLWMKDVGSSVYDIAFSPDGSHVAAACQDGSVHLYDTNTMAVQYLRGHGDQVFTVAHSPDGKTIASGTWGGDLVLWDLVAKTHRTIKAHESDLRGLAISSDGKLIASGSWDSTIKIWSADGAKLHQFGTKGVRVHGVSFSPDGAFVASGDGTYDVRIWRLADGTHSDLDGHTRDVTSVDFSPSGDLVVSSSGDTTIRLWRVADGKPVAVVESEAQVRRVRFGPDGRTFAAGSTDMTVRVWDAKDAALRARFEGHEGEVNAIAFHPRGHALASAGYDETIRVWRLEGVEDRPSRGHTALTFGVAFSDDVKRIASGGYDRTIRIWDASTGEQLKSIDTPRPVRGVAFSPDGTMLAAATTDEIIRLYDTATGMEKKSLTGHTAAALDVIFSRDGKRVVSASWDKSIRIWDSATGEPTAVLTGHKDEVMSLSFSPRGDVLASASADGTIRLWSASNGRELSVLRGHTGTVYGVSFHPEENRLVSAGADGTIRLWDAATGRVIKTRHEKGRLYSAVFHPDGKRVGICGSESGSVIWDTESDDIVRLRGHRGEVNYLAFGSAGTLVATTSDDQTVRVWDAATGRPYWTAPVMLSSPPVFRSHRGWRHIDGTTPTDPDLERSAWARNVASARAGQQSPNGSLLCVVSHGGELEGWDLGSDRRLFRVAIAPAAQPFALDDRCLAFTEPSDTRAGDVLSVNRDGETKVVAVDATAVGLSRGEILVASGGRVHRYDAQGIRLGTIDAVIGITALGRVGDWIVAGNCDGNLDLIPAEPGAARPTHDFEDTPSSPVVHVLEGPMGTVVASYANGFLGIWDARNGSILDRARLHGAMAHVRVASSKLFAVTELGDSAVLDLSVYEEPYCSLLHRVWDQVPVAWEEGLPVLRPPPDDHRCSR